MGSEYNPERRIEGIRPLSPVSKNEATQATDETLTRRWGAAREALADELRRAQQPKRSFKELLKQPK